MTQSSIAQRFMPQLSVPLLSMTPLSIKAMPWVPRPAPASGPDAASADKGCTGLSTPMAIVLSGGCFQNALLLEATIRALHRRGHPVHRSELVPCNDGGLALGQLEALRRQVQLEG